MDDMEAGKENEPSASFNSSAYYSSDDPDFLEALHNAVLPGDEGFDAQPKDQDLMQVSVDASRPECESWPSRLEGPSHLKRHRELSTSPSPGEPMTDSLEDVYGASKFGGFGEYMRRKRAKLQIQNVEIGDQHEASGHSGKGHSGIFRGLSIYINGWTDPSVQVLRELIVKHGGVFQPYLDKKGIVTHIVTCSLTPAKIREFKHMKVVKPLWLVESAKRGVLLPWRNFLYQPGDRLEKTQGVPSPQMKLSDLYDDLHKTQQDDDMHGEVVIDMEKLMALEIENPARSQLPFPSTYEPASTVPQKPFPPPKARPLAKPGLLYTTDHATKAQAARVPGYATHHSNPNAARLMSDPAWRAAHTSAAPDFIDGFYKNSRLHHLSTWKAELRQLVAAAQTRAQAHSQQAGNDQSPPGDAGQIPAGTTMKGATLVLKSPSKKDKGKERAVDPEERVIMHCDFDCFFVSVGLLDHPTFRGRPAVVCHSQGAQGGLSSTSEIASASYEARACGIKNGMSLQQARKLCPTVVTIPYEFEKYKDISLKFYTVLMEHADDMEAVSVDEALVDVTDAVRRWSLNNPDRSSAKDFADYLRKQVKDATGCEVSIGISRNILLARLATKRAKPAGSYHLTAAEVPLVLAPLDVADLPGFGYSAKHKVLEKFKTSQLGKLLQHRQSEFSAVLGAKTGEKLYKAIRGVDDRVLESEKKRASVSSEISYGIRFESDQQAVAFVVQMAHEVSRRLKDIKMVGNSITLKLMKRDPKAPVEASKFLGHGICDVFNKQSPLSANGRPTDDGLAIAEHACRLLRGFGFDPRELRGVGIHVTKLEDAPEPKPGRPTNVNMPGARPSAPRPAVTEQTRLPFAISPKKRRLLNAARDRRKSTSQGAPPRSTSSKPAIPPQIAGDPSAVKPAYDDLPSFSQVDKSVFHALPYALQEELKAEYKRRSVSTASALGAARKGPVPSTSGNIRKPIGDVARKEESGMSRFLKRVAAKLGMEVRGPAAGSSKRHALVVLGMRRRQHARFGMAVNLGVPSSDLRDLGIDPEVFSILPPGVQREQLILAKYVKQHGKMPEGPKNRRMLKPKWKPLHPRIIVRLPMPRARWRQPPMLKQRSSVSSKGKEKAEEINDKDNARGAKESKGNILYFSHTGDVQNVIGRWVAGFTTLPPKERDTESFRKWVVRSLGGEIASDGSIGVGESDIPALTDKRRERMVHMDYIGLERVRAVLMWWRVLLRRHWPECEWSWDIPDEELNVLTYPRAPDDDGDGEPVRYWDIGREDEIEGDAASDEKRNAAVPGVPTRAEIGNAWWRAFMMVKDAADTLARRRYGGSLALN